ncbi:MULTISPECIES: YqjK-like family protein [Halomonas]|uniref:YqjK-like protein n=1 Tax=Halomonas ventosae TaxID=229007 RepID=A0A4R6I4Y2_9GAMM|nr:YqjK family protein [Halomonas ventosae]TDO16504.1 YqjK-like protein [Halomonas ventosae]
MTGPETHKTLSRSAHLDNSAASLALRKAQLEASIEQERVDIMVETSRWRDASRPIDDGWHFIMRFRIPLYIAGGALLVKGARHPSALIRLARRLATGRVLVSQAQRLLDGR